jgi:hypothetical protein
MKELMPPSVQRLRNHDLIDDRQSETSEISSRKNDSLTGK